MARHLPSRLRHGPAVFGLLAVTLTTVGIYGVMAYSVTRRTKEIGIRLALGAEHADVMKMVLRQGLKLTSFGVAIGLLTALLAVVAMAASFLPARRASRVDPLVALRHE